MFLGIFFLFLGYYALLMVSKYQVLPIELRPLMFGKEKNLDILNFVGIVLILIGFCFLWQISPLIVFAIIFIYIVLLKLTRGNNTNKKAEIIKILKIYKTIKKDFPENNEKELCLKTISKYFDNILKLRRENCYWNKNNTYSFLEENIKKQKLCSIQTVIINIFIHERSYNYSFGDKNFLSEHLKNRKETEDQSKLIDLIYKKMIK